MLPNKIYIYIYRGNQKIIRSNLLPPSDEYVINFCYAITNCSASWNEIRCALNYGFIIIEKRNAVYVTKLSRLQMKRFTKVLFYYFGAFLLVVTISTTNRNWDSNFTTQSTNRNAPK